jgi:hypothetical protein
MNTPPTNERLQFSIGALLIYTFGMAAMVSMLVCKSPETVFPAWLLLGLFFFIQRNKESTIILGSAIVWFILILTSAHISDVSMILMVSCKISGIVSFIAYHFFLFVRSSNNM